MSSFIDDFKDDNKQGSHKLKKNAANRKLKPRFSVNLLDDDYKQVQDYCEKMGMSCAALARMLLLKEITK